MTGRQPRRWFAAIPITGRFYIMFAILLLAVAGIVFGALRAVHEQSEAGADLARLATVQRSLDRALTLHSSINTQQQVSAPSSGASSQDLLSALRAQLEATWSMPATPEVAAIVDSLRQPAAQYFQAMEGQLRTASPGGSTDWSFAELEPRRAALETGLREAMSRMRVVLQRVETRVVAGLDRAAVKAGDRKSTRLNSSHSQNAYAVFCLKKKIKMHR